MKTYEIDVNKIKTLEHSIAMIRVLIYALGAREHLLLQEGFFERDPILKELIKNETD